MFAGGRRTTALDVLELYIELIDGLTVVARCENALDAFAVLQQQPIDLMFLDITMPKLLEPISCARYGIRRK